MKCSWSSRCRRAGSDAARLLAPLLGLAAAGGCAEPVEIADRRPVGGLDVTFLVAADTHCGADGIETLNRKQIDAMNALPGTPWPADVGGRVATPKAVIVAGDLTNRGLGSQWKQFQRLYGRTGKDGLLKYPVKICSGNHDRHVPIFRPAVAGVKQRHGGLCYSWDWGDLHVVCLDEYPSAANRRWLARDLAAVGKRLPVVIWFHYPLLGPFADFWKDKDKDAFARAIEGFNVIAIFHGHYHGSGHYRWRGRDVYNVGSPRHSDHSFAAVRVTDTRLTVAEWNWDARGWQWRHAKPIGRAGAP